MTTIETRRLTLKEFDKLYQDYKDIFDLELLMNRSGKTYAKLQQEAIKNEEWF